MCLQDLQLARGVLVTEHSVSALAGGIALTLPSDETRFGLLLSGPNTGSVETYYDTFTGSRMINNVSSSAGHTVRYIDVFNVGYVLRRPILFRASAAMTFQVLEYSLPTDPETLKRLATLARW